MNRSIKCVLAALVVPPMAGLVLAQEAQPRAREDLEALRERIRQAEGQVKAAQERLETLQGERPAALLFEDDRQAIYQHAARSSP